VRRPAPFCFSANAPYPFSDAKSVPCSFFLSYFTRFSCREQNYFIFYQLLKNNFFSTFERDVRKVPFQALESAFQSEESAFLINLPCPF